MASIRLKTGSPFWFACFYSADGKRLQLSTKQSDKRKALGIANEWERAAKLASERRLGETQAREVLARIYRITNEAPLSSASARDYLTSWAKSRDGELAERTVEAYQQVVRDFVASLGNRADRDISQLTRADVAAFRDSVKARTSIATANKTLKYLRIAMGAAVKNGYAQDNPAAKVDTLKRKAEDRFTRRAFTLDEMKTIIEHASEEWVGIILAGLYTGARLGDIASLSWANVDLIKRELRFVTGKTGRQMHIPIAKPLHDYLQGLTTSDDPDAPLFPRAYEIAVTGGSDSRLSQQFHGILVAAGLADARKKDKTGKGRAQGRRVSDISFHSLRHTATSLLKTAGVAESVAMDIIGHNTTAMSRHYTHIDTADKRTAVDKLPDVSKPRSGGQT